MFGLLGNPSKEGSQVKEVNSAAAAGGGGYSVQNFILASTHIGSCNFQPDLIS